jgi:Flp pilus assembly protein TadG
VSRKGGERGDAVTETVLLVPALLLLVMLVIQFGLWYHAQHVVQAAAQEGARAARVQGATADDGLARAARFLAVTGSGGVQAPAVQAERSGEFAIVRVEGRAPAVVPGLRLGVRSLATSPVEEFSRP